MQLNKTDGSILFDNQGIGSDQTIAQIQDLKDIYRIRQGVINAGYSTLYVNGIEEDELSMAFVFYENKLFMISISLGSKYQFPPFVITDAERDILKNKLKGLGGAVTYNWGQMEISEDRKGGSLSILLKYKQ